MNKKCLILFLLFIVAVKTINAQQLEPYVHQGEIGLSLGLDHYFGDLDPNYALGHPKFAAGAFYQRQLNNYIGVRVSGNYAFLGYSDIYSPNAIQRRRNLSFNTDVWELSVSGSFNFFKFYPGFPEYNHTPYVSLGLGMFSFNPYTYLQGQKYFLQPIGTEGEGSALYPDRKKYSLTAISIPIGLGYKYALNENINVFGEIVYRFTTTDYLDDVSTTYAPDAFPPDKNGNPTVGYLLQDRSYETGTSIGIKGRQRGNSPQKDAFVTFQVGISFNLQSYHCPPSTR